MLVMLLANDFISLKYTFSTILGFALLEISSSVSSRYPRAAAAINAVQESCRGILSSCEHNFEGIYTLRVAFKPAFPTLTRSSRSRNRMLSLSLEKAVVG